MNRAVLLALLLCAPRGVLAGAGADPAPRRVTLHYEGPLREAVKQIAEAGGLSLVVTGRLEAPAELHLQDVSPEQALRTVADAYGLELGSRDGIYTLKPRGAAASVAPGLTESKPLKRTGARAVARGRDLEVRADEAVQSAVAFGGDLAIRGEVEEDAVSYGGDVEVTGRVGGDALAFGGDLVLRPGAVVKGDARSFGGEVRREEGAAVEGDASDFPRQGAGQVQTGMRDSDEEDDHSEGRMGRLADFLLRFALLFGLGCVFSLLLPARMRELEVEIRTRPVLSGLLGLIASVALVPLTVVLVVTLVGIPVAIALWLAVGLAWAMGFAASASALGMRIPVLRKKKTQALALAGGAAGLLLLISVPILGWLVGFAVGCVGLGAVVRTRFGRPPQGLPRPWDIPAG